MPSDPGVIIAQAEKKMGLHGSPTHAVTFDGARVPREHLLGIEGRGLPQTLATLDDVGTSGRWHWVWPRQPSRKRWNTAKEREAFGQPIANFQAIQWMLADAATEIEAARDSWSTKPPG